MALCGRSETEWKWQKQKKKCPMTARPMSIRYLVSNLNSDQEYTYIVGLPSETVHSPKHMIGF